MHNYILEIRKFIPDKICKKIISYFDDSFEDAITVGGLDKNIRNCLKQEILYTNTLGKKIVSNYIQSKMYEIAEIYKSKHSYFNFKKLSQLEILKYDANGYDAGYKYHVDFAGSCSERHISISINLNNDYTGGEFVFDMKGDIKQYPQNTGDVLVFPSNFLYPHQVNKIISGTRYALIGWVV